MIFTCIIASQMYVTPLPLTWIDGTTSMGSVVHPCVAEHHFSEKELLKKRIEKMKRENYG